MEGRSPYSHVPQGQSDPWNEVRDDVETSLSGARTLFVEWENFLRNTNTANSPSFVFTQKELLRALTNLEGDVQNLQLSLQEIVRRRADFPITEGELNNRKQFVSNAANTIQKMRAAMNSDDTRNKIEKDKREALMHQTKSAGGAARLEAREKAVEEDNEQFLQSQMIEKQRIMDEQSKGLDQVRVHLASLDHKARLIRDELEDQEKIEEEVLNQVEETNNAIVSVYKKVDKLIDQSSNTTSWTIIGVLIALLVILLVVIFYIK
eukprot:TRINITY_DN160_c1_g1_i1.p1 TRINITY_DN160_c1_g1~~TRINITY_DN160_c1_g1_i1.p1  ORF type:complete len:275 (-),score=88.16 TRINITY_DN160_c1_g1_i1:338-1129(-)